MIGRLKNDKSYSTVSGHLGMTFNTDGKLRTNLTIEDAREAFNFSIEKRQSYDVDGRKIPGHYHLVRSDTNDIIPSASIGEKFTPYNHSEVLKYVIDSILPKFSDMQLETVGTLHGGGTGLITARIGNPFYVKGDESPCFARMVVSNPCNGCGSLVIGFVIVREYCQNCIPVVDSKSSGLGRQIHHTKNADSYVSSVISSIGNYIDKVKRLHHIIDILADTQYDGNIMSILDKLMPLKGGFGSRGYNRILSDRNDVIAQFEGAETAMQIHGMSLWKVLNAFTFPIFNPRKYTNTLDESEVAYTGMIGCRASKVSAAFSEICEIAKDSISL